MADSQVTLRTRKFIRNPLLGRRQMVVDVLHPNRANVSKDELRSKLAELYKAKKDEISVFGFRTQYGGGKSTGFALIYESPEAMKKFEPHYRLVRVGMATKIEKASRQQRTYNPGIALAGYYTLLAGIERDTDWDSLNREATQEQVEGVPGYGQDEGCFEGQEEINDSFSLRMVLGRLWGLWSSVTAGGGLESASCTFTYA
ncbi:hypothetical protein AOQ84DRAFT_60940 [Glonium stellatum]|uniref:40S ribosomal protein S24 n=1 Tax=Glonium stellatum TaxID=574774 RepID=A0A8E2K0E9_9PEZI|nr:hypothetical protein AOQ84DRAFT_60940 [Glonium stellatum]